MTSDFSGVDKDHLGKFDEIMTLENSCPQVFHFASISHTCRNFRSRTEALQNFRSRIWRLQTCKTCKKGAPDFRQQKRRGNHSPYSSKTPQQEPEFIHKVSRITAKDTEISEVEKHENRHVTCGRTLFLLRKSRCSVWVIKPLLDNAPAAGHRWLTMIAKYPRSRWTTSNLQECPWRIVFVRNCPKYWMVRDPLWKMQPLGKINSEILHFIRLRRSPC